MEIVRSMIGAAVNEVIAGGSNGSMVVIELDHNYVLFLYCCWRMNDADSVLCGWNDQESCLVRIKELEGDTVLTVDVGAFYDIVIKFASGRELRVMCDITPGCEDGQEENWSICNKQANICYVVDKQFQLIETKFS
ncbi:hypothetical protein [Paenibacillus spongiae]|uniref:DUF3992 domain-containing protein n=1 Tax=Paenibacillus spongiae TaxID=2909671 RepID=A0ABY5SJS3_9BACL|nr:hypothetical protein [Paenibacillus spongiae]UVI32920.1 hypothetical protein L1F29_14255 [Paenibacillus spongiae]